MAKAAAVVGGVSQPRSSVLTEEDDAFSLDSLTAAAEHEQLPPERKAPCEADSHRDAFEIALRVRAFPQLVVLRLGAKAAPRG